MSESEQPGPEQTSAEQGSSANIAEKAAGLRAAQPPTPSDVEVAKEADEQKAASGSGIESQVSEDAGDAADVATNAPTAAQPGQKDSPDMKDMAVGPRPVDDQSRE